jgi:hypothetical protein
MKGGHRSSDQDLAAFGRLDPSVGFIGEYPNGGELIFHLLKCCKDRLPADRRLRPQRRQRWPQRSVRDGVPLKERG